VTSNPPSRAFPEKANLLAAEKKNHTFPRRERDRSSEESRKGFSLFFTEEPPSIRNFFILIRGGKKKGLSKEGGGQETAPGEQQGGRKLKKKKKFSRELVFEKNKGSNLIERKFLKGGLPRRKKKRACPEEDPKAGLVGIGECT